LVVKKIWREPTQDREEEENPSPTLTAYNTERRSMAPLKADTKYKGTGVISRGRRARVHRK